MAVDYRRITNQQTNVALQGKAVWFDVVTEDVDAAIDFYRDAFGWSFEVRQNDVYAVATNNGQPVAAIAAFEEGDPNKGDAVWLTSISIGDVDAVTQSDVREGGEVVDGPETLAGRGRYIVVRDPQGALVMLLNAQGGDPADGDIPDNSWLWSEL